MNSEDQKIYQEYKWSRDNIQLVDAYVTEIISNKLVDNIPDNCEKTLEVIQRVELNENENEQQFAYLKVNILIMDKDKEPLARIEVTCKGIFIYNGKIERDDLKHLIKVQTAPQLFPYVRSAVTTLSSIMALSRLTLPTIDIINSIRKNQEG